MTTFKNSIKNNFLQHYDSSKFIKPLNKINHIKLSAIMHETSPTNNLCNKIYPRQVERILHKGPHSHSTYIKKIKYSGNENNCWTNDRPREIESASRGRYNKQMIKEIHSEIQHKSRQSKSFAIRKKNTSNYTNKRSDSFKKCELPLQNQIDKLKREIVSYSKKTSQKNNGRKVNFVSNPCQSQSTKMQNENQVHSHCPPKNGFVEIENSHKINQVIEVDRQSRKSCKFFNNGRSSHIWQPDVPLPNYKKSVQSGKNIHKLLKKIRNASKSSLQNNKATQKQQISAGESYVLKEKPNIKTKTEKASEQKQNKNDKHRVHSGCKTIRVPWGSSQGSSFNEIQNRETKKQVKQPKCSSRKQVEINVNQDIFGGISIIAANKCEGLLKNNSIPTESLKQIYEQLQNIEELQHQQAISKQLI